MSSKIGLELVLLRSRRTTGIERFAAGIWDHLDGLQHNRYWPVMGLPFKLPGRTFDRVVNEQVTSLHATRWSGIHYFSISPPVLLPSVGFSLTIHDATPWRFPEMVSRGMKLIYKSSIERAVAAPNFRGIVTVSQFSASELHDALRVPSTKIWVVPNGLATEFTNAHYARSGLSSAPEQPYCLFVGTLEPRKNLRELLEAWSLSGTGMRLVVVGRVGWGPQISADGVCYLPNITTSELWKLYQNAEVVVQPSLYEGFSLVPLEALAAGTPVVLRALPVYGETVGQYPGVTLYQTLEDLVDLLRSRNWAPASAKSDIAAAYSLEESARRFHIAMENVFG